MTIVYCEGQWSTDILFIWLWLNQSIFYLFKTLFCIWSNYTYHFFFFSNWFLIFVWFNLIFWCHYHGSLFLCLRRTTLFWNLLTFFKTWKWHLNWIIKSKKYIKTKKIETYPSQNFLSLISIEVTYYLNFSVNFPFSVSLTWFYSETTSYFRFI